jgi:hypothetical protein
MQMLLFPTWNDGPAELRGGRWNWAGPMNEREGFLVESTIAR